MKKYLPVLGTTIFTLAAILTAPACKQGPKINEGDIVIILKQQEGQTLAKVGKRNLTVEELKKDFIDRQGSFKGAPNLNTEKARSDYVENQVVQEAMFQKAVEEGYFNRPDVKRDIVKTVVQRFVRNELEKSQTQFVPTEEQIKEHYNKNLNLYNRDEAIKVAYVHIPFGSKKEKSKALANAIQKDALEIKNSNTREFSRLAMKHAPQMAAGEKISIETNETDYLEKAAFESKFGPGAFESVKGIEQIGQVAPMITTADAFVVMMKTGYRKTLNETMEEAKDKIIKRLAYENRGETHKLLVERLRKEYNIEVNKELIAELSKGVTPPEQVAKGTPGNNQNQLNNAKAALGGDVEAEAKKPASEQAPVDPNH